MGELYECDVMWAEKCYQGKTKGRKNDPNPRAMNLNTASNFTASKPISIPKAQVSSACMYTENCCSGEEEDGMEVVPPHVWVSRSRSGERMIDSVRMSQGRTLKGRELKHVRDSVLRMTGFLEV